MSQITAKLVENKDVWEDFVLNSPESNFLHSFNWGKFNQSLGFAVFRLGFYRQGKLKGVALLVKKTARRGTYLECPAGPLIPWGEPGFFDHFLSDLKVFVSSFIHINTIISTLLYESFPGACHHTYC